MKKKNNTVCVGCTLQDLLSLANASYSEKITNSTQEQQRHKEVVIFYELYTSTSYSYHMGGPTLAQIIVLLYTRYDTDFVRLY